VVFVVNNNQWAISVPRKAQTAAQTIAQKAIATGFSGVQVDGNDVIAVRYGVAEAIQRARSGEGPALVEAVNYRLSDHTTADDARRYSEEKRVKEAWGFEPVARLRSYLIKQNLWTENDEKKLLEECTQEVDKAVQEYLKISPAPLTDMFDYLYETLPEELVVQRNELGTG
jgi:pyruvate dehydrogenase E1 component alpha subunit